MWRLNNNIIEMETEMRVPSSPDQTVNNSSQNENQSPITQTNMTATNLQLSFEQSSVPVHLDPKNLDRIKSDEEDGFKLNEHAKVDKQSLNYQSFETQKQRSGDLVGRQKQNIAVMRTHYQSRAGTTKEPGPRRGSNSKAMKQQQALFQKIQDYKQNVWAQQLREARAEGQISVPSPLANQDLNDIGQVGNRKRRGGYKAKGPAHSNFGGTQTISLNSSQRNSSHFGSPPPDSSIRRIRLNAKDTLNLKGIGSNLSSVYGQRTSPGQSYSNQYHVENNIQPVTKIALKGQQDSETQVMPTERQKVNVRKDVLVNDIKMFDGQVGSASNSKDSVGVPKMIDRAIEQYEKVLIEEKITGASDRKKFTQVAPSAFKFDRSDPMIERRQQQWQLFLSSHNQRPKFASRGAERSKKGSSALLSPQQQFTPNMSILSQDIGWKPMPTGNTLDSQEGSVIQPQKRSKTTSHSTRIAAAKARSISQRRQINHNLLKLSPPSTAGGTRTVVSPRTYANMSISHGYNQIQSNQLCQEANQIYRDPFVRNKAVALAMTLKSRCENKQAMSKNEIFDRRNTVFTPPSAFSPFSGFGPQHIPGEFGPFPPSANIMLFSKDNNTDRNSLETHFGTSASIEGAGDFMKSTLLEEGQRLIEQAEMAGAAIRADEVNEYNSARKEARSRKKKIKLGKKSNVQRNKDSKFKVVVMDPSMNVRDLNSLKQLDQDPEKADAHGTLVNGTLASLNREGIPTNTSKNPIQNLISMENVLGTHQVNSHRNSLDKQIMAMENDHIQVNSLLQNQVLAFDTLSPPGMLEGTAAFQINPQIDGFSDKLDMTFEQDPNVVHGGPWIADGSQQLTPRGVQQYTRDETLKIKEKLKQPPPKQKQLGLKGQSVHQKSIRGHNMLKPLQVVKIPNPSKVLKGITLSPDISPKRIQEMDTPGIRSMVDSTALRPEQNQKSSSSLPKQASRSSKGCSPLAPNIEIQEITRNVVTPFPIKLTNQSQKQKYSLKKDDSQSNFIRNNSEKNLDPSQNDILKNEGSTVRHIDNDQLVTSLEDQFEEFLNGTVNNSQAEEPANGPKVPTPIRDSRLHQVGKRTGSMASVKDGPAMFVKENLKSCGSKEGKKKRNVLSPIVNNIQTLSLKYDFDGQNYFKFGVRKSRNKIQQVKTENYLKKKNSIKVARPSNTQKRGYEWMTLGMQPFEIDLQENQSHQNNKMIAGTHCSVDSKGSIESTERLNPVGRIQLQTANALQMNLKEGKKPQKSKQPQNMIGINISKPITINDENYSPASPYKNHSSTFGRLKIDTENSIKKRKSLISRQAETQPMSPFNLQSDVKSELEVQNYNSPDIQTPLLTLGKKQGYQSSNQSQINQKGNKTVVSHNRSKSSARNLNSDLFKNYNLIQGVQVSALLKEAGIQGYNQPKSIKHRKMSQDSQIEYQKDLDAKNEVNLGETIKSEKQNKEQNKEMIKPARLDHILQDPEVSEVFTGGSGDISKEKTPKAGVKVTPRSPVLIKGEFNIDNVDSYETVLSEQAVSGLLSVENITKVKVHQEVLNTEKLNLLTYASSIIDQEANNTLDQTISEFRGYLQACIRRFKEQMPKEVQILHTQNPQEKIANMIKTQNTYGVLQQQNERKINLFKQNERKKNLEKMSKMRTQVIDQDLMLKQNPATKEVNLDIVYKFILRDKKTTPAQKARIISNIKREKALFVLSQVCANQLANQKRAKVADKQRSSQIVLTQPADKQENQDFNDALQCQTFSTNFQQELANADREVKNQLKELDDLLEQQRAKQIFVIKELPVSKKSKENENLLRVEDKKSARKVETEQRATNRSEKSMEEIKLQTRSPVATPKIKFVRPNRGQTQINLNKYSLKHQISFDKNLISIKGGITNKVSHEKCSKNLNQDISANLAQESQNMCAAGMQTSIQLQSETTPRDRASSPGGLTITGYSPIRRQAKLYLGQPLPSTGGEGSPYDQLDPIAFTKVANRTFQNTHKSPIAITPKIQGSPRHHVLRSTSVTRKEQESPTAAQDKREPSPFKKAIFSSVVQHESNHVITPDLTPPLQNQQI